MAHPHRAAVGSEHRRPVHLDQLVDTTVKLGEFIVAAGAGGRRKLVEKSPAARVDIGGKLGLTRLGDIAQFDVEPLGEFLAAGGQGLG